MTTLSQYEQDFPGTNLVEYPYPLRNGMIVKLILPADLTQHEAMRLARFMESLIDDKEEDIASQIARFAE